MNNYELERSSSLTSLSTFPDFVDHFNGKIKENLEGNAQSEYLDPVLGEDMYVDIRLRQAQTQMHTQMQTRRSGEFLVKSPYPIANIGCLYLTV